MGVSAISELNPWPPVIRAHQPRERSWVWQSGLAADRLPPRPLLCCLVELGRECGLAGLILLGDCLAQRLLEGSGLEVE